MKYYTEGEVESLMHFMMGWLAAHYGKDVKHPTDDERAVAIKACMRIHDLVEELEKPVKKKT